MRRANGIVKAAAKFVKCFLTRKIIPEFFNIADFVKNRIPSVTVQQGNDQRRYRSSIAESKNNPENQRYHSHRMAGHRFHSLSRKDNSDNRTGQSDERRAAADRTDDGQNQPCEGVAVFFSRSRRGRVGVRLLRRSLSGILLLPIELIITVSTVRIGFLVL